jgi:threonine synthase
MDVGNPSNFPRLTEVFGNQFPEIKEQISAYSYSDSETEKTMQEIDQKHNYTLDPHGAVGYLGLQAYLKESGIEANGVFLETAHPAKFLDVVEPALNRKVDLPKPLAELMDKPKVAIQMENDFEEFKQYLLKL